VPPNKDGQSDVNTGIFRPAKFSDHMSAGVLCDGEFAKRCCFRPCACRHEILRQPFVNLKMTIVVPLIRIGVLSRHISQGNLKRRLDDKDIRCVRRVKISRREDFPTFGRDQSVSSTIQLGKIAFEIGCVRVRFIAFARAV